MSGVEESRNGAVFPPNKPMEPRMEYSKQPVIYDQLMFIDFSDEGSCILGVSDISGTFWEGTLFYLKNAEALKSFDYCGHYIYDCTSDGKFIDNKTVALAEDTGHVNILSFSEDYIAQSVNYFQCSERIPQIGVWKDSNRIISCSGRSISIWEIDNLSREPLEVFNNYHVEAVTCIDTLKTETNCFISGSRDRCVCLWDLRSPEPGSVLYTNEFASITDVAWNQGSDNLVAVGTQGGAVYLLDRRVPSDVLSSVHCFNASVNRIAFKDDKEFGVCGDTQEVLIVDIDGDILREVYRDTRHKGHVKGMAWSGGDLYTCGFGKSVVKHSRI